MSIENNVSIFPAIIFALDNHGSKFYQVEMFETDFKSGWQLKKHFRRLKYGTIWNPMDNNNTTFLKLNFELIQIFEAVNSKEIHRHSDENMCVLCIGL